jgi:hypothetical protein
MHQQTQHNMCRTQLYTNKHNTTFVGHNYTQKHNTKCVGHTYAKKTQHNMCRTQLYTSNIVFTIQKLNFVLLRVFIFRVPSCDVRYHLRIKTMLCSSLPPFICRRVHIWLTLFVFVGICLVWCLCVIYVFCIYLHLLVSSTISISHDVLVL